MFMPNPRLTFPFTQEPYMPASPKPQPTPSPKPQIGEVWDFQDANGHHPMGYYTTAPLFHVDEDTVSWMGVAGCIVILRRDRLVKPHEADCPCGKCAEKGKFVASDKSAPTKLDARPVLEGMKSCVKKQDADPDCKACDGTGRITYRDGCSHNCSCTAPSPKACYGCGSSHVVPGKRYCQTCLSR